MMYCKGGNSTLILGEFLMDDLGVGGHSHGRWLYIGVSI